MATRTAARKTTKSTKGATKAKPDAAPSKPKTAKPKRSIKDFAPDPPAAKPPAVKDEKTLEKTPVPAPVPAVTELRKRELMHLVSEKTGLQRNKVRPAVEAAIEVLGEAILAGRQVNIPPLGKIKPKRTREFADTKITVAKIRQNKPDQS
ncbi:MAG: HU family DNA-binding protein [Pseudomonadota bacterium]